MNMVTMDEIDKLSYDIETLEYFPGNAREVARCFREFVMWVNDEGIAGITVIDMGRIQYE